MPDHVKIKRALISVSDKADIVAFARSLRTMGVEIISTGGTARTLREAGIETLAVEEITEFPEMMDGRVKTLHPRIHGGLLGRRDLPTHVEAMETHGIPEIDLVCINLYPFERTVSNPNVAPQNAIEQIDIGGPAALRSASKNYEFVTIVTSPGQYDDVISEMKSLDAATTLHLRRQLAAAAFARTAGYDAAISNWLAKSTEDALPPRLHLSATRVSPLRYGENPHQSAALYALPGTGEAAIDGKPLSFNNLNDAAAAYRCCRDLSRATNRIASCVIKHATPCGLGVGDDAGTAFQEAWSGDPMAAFGGIVGVSSEVDAATASLLTADGRFIEVIMAPAFTDEAVEALTSRWKNIRLVCTPDLREAPAGSVEVKSIPGGLLAQTPDTTVTSPAAWTHAAGPAPSEAALQAALMAQIAAKHAASNAVTLATPGRLTGVGAGQVDRVSAARIAILKAGDILNGDTVIAAGSDAFFPFDDGPGLLIDAGVNCIVHPGGSKRDDDTFARCNERGVTCMVTGVRHFRH